ncbi:hypothetical protein [Streptomyces nitrosporeus]|uniref:hypothetical protein n=1 Tax=Streptomyces nitrosporeus TaxID=28894 RepID=UPI0039A03FFB
MSRLPGPPRDDARPWGRPAAPAARRMRHALAALLLAVLTLVGAPAAAGAVPVAQVLAASAPAAVPSYPAPQVSTGQATPGHARTQRTDRAPRYGGVHDVRGGQAAPAGGGTAAARAAMAATGSPPPPGPAAGPRATRGPPAGGAVPDSVSGPSAWWAGVFAPGPRAGADRPHVPHHVPPLGQAALPPRLLGLPAPRLLTGTADRARPAVPGGALASLPGVRGPPGVTAGQPAVHRSCSTDPSYRHRLL